MVSLVKLEFPFRLHSIYYLLYSICRYIIYGACIGNCVHVNVREWKGVHANEQTKIFQGADYSFAILTALCLLIIHVHSPLWFHHNCLLTRLMHIALYDHSLFLLLHHSPSLRSVEYVDMYYDHMQSLSWYNTASKHDTSCVGNMHKHLWKYNH